MNAFKKIKLRKENSKNNPYFYTMYAYVRCCSILEKKKPTLDKNLDKNELLKNYDLLSKIINFPISPQQPGFIMIIILATLC